MQAVIPMLRSSVKTFLICILTFAVVACGGGGGGDSDGSNSGGSAATGIRLIHAALDIAPLQINSAEGGILSTAHFGQIAFHGSLAPGSANLLVTTSANPLVGIWSTPTELAKNERKSVLAFGGYENRDVQFSLLSDAGSDIPNGQSAVRVVNGVSGSGSVSVAIAGIGASAGAAVGAASSYLLVVPGTYEFVVNASGTPVGRVSGTLVEGQAYSVVSQGAAGYFVRTNLLVD